MLAEGLLCNSPCCCLLRLVLFLVVLQSFVGNC